MMSRNRFKSLCFAIIVAISAMMGSSSAVAHRGDRQMGLFEDGMAEAARHINDGHEALRRELEQARQQIAQLQGQVNELQFQLVESQTLVSERDAAIIILEEEIARLQIRIAELESQQSDSGQDPTGNLWFHVPEVQYNEKRTVRAHYVPWMPALIENRAMSEDYWTRAWLNNTGESNKHLAYGGYVTNAPYHSGPFPANNEAEWRKAGALEEVAYAQQFGIDGFYVDLVDPDLADPNSKHSHRAKVVALLQAAKERGFELTPMIDTNGTGMKAASADVIASGLAKFFAFGTSWKLSDGRYVVGVFSATGALDAGWTQVKYDAIASGLSSRGYPVVFLAAYVDVRKAGNYNFPYEGPWSPGAVPKILERQSRASVMPAKDGNARRYSSWYDESRGTGAMRASWNSIVRAGDTQVQMVTWNDYAEGTEMGPSRAKGTFALAYGLWRAMEWKTGTLPSILENQVVLSHRTQTVKATITGGQTKFLSQNTNRSELDREATVDEIEVLTLFTQEQEVKVFLDGRLIASYAASAGASVRYVPFTGGGEVSVTWGQDGEYFSPVRIKTSSVADDRQWVHAWSGDLIEVADPRVNS